jgi:hypothetical protein
MRNSIRYFITLCSGMQENICIRLFPIKLCDFYLCIKENRINIKQDSIR